MIERVHDNERNNVRINVSSNGNVKLPKNIRQVGQAGANKKIYIEDYVMSYIKQMAMKNYGSYQAAVLLGNSTNNDGVEHIFIYGAVQIKGIRFEEEKVFTNESWTDIYETIKEYFEESEIVGWYLTRPGLTLEVDDHITKIHLDNFAGPNKVLLLYDSVEREEVFYLYTNGMLKKQTGYYVFYEKNEAMQSYMVEREEKSSIEAGYVDHTSAEIRNVLEKRRVEKKSPKRNANSFTYAAATIMAVLILVATATVLSRINGKGSAQVNSEKTGDEYVATTDGTVEKDKDTTVDVTQGSVGDQTAVDEDKVVVSDEIKQETEEGAVENSPNTSEETSAEANSQSDKPNVTIEGTDPTDTAGNDDSTIVTGGSAVKTHEVVKGDTLRGISMKYYNTKSYVEEIMKLNNLEDDKIYIGQTIKLP